MTPVVAAVNLRDCGNVGAIARTATAFGFAAVLTVGTTPPLTRKEARKVALGGGLIPSTHYSSLAAALQAYPDHYVVALETGGQPLNTWEPPLDRPILLLLGSERHGLCAPELATAQSVISIPHQTDTVASLNVAAAFAIAAYTLSMVH